jgi:hypothetical protein
VRHFDYKIEQQYIDERLARQVRSMTILVGHLDRRVADADYLTTAVQSFFEFAQERWVAGSPVDDVAGLFERAAFEVGRSLGSGTLTTHFGIIEWINAACIAANWPVAERVAAMVLTMEHEGPDDERAAHDHRVAVAHLVTGNDTAATTAAQAVTSAIDSPATYPGLVEGLPGLDQLVIAVAARDPIALATACTTRATVLKTRFGRSSGTRRQVIAYLDTRAAAIISIGHHRGLALPTGLTDALAIDLITRPRHHQPKT